MDRFAIESGAGQGTTITIKKLIRPGSLFLHARDLGRLSESLAREGLQSPLAEVQQQNQELLHVLEDLRRPQEDLVRLNRELEDSNAAEILQGLARAGWTADVPTPTSLRPASRS
jgi:hypothetical protein